MKTIATHNGGFHGDDVFAVATLLLIFPDAKIVRSRSPEIISQADIVVDVGGIYDPTQNRFDHHQIEGAGKRENGIPYASFGLVWKEFGERISGSAEIAKNIEDKLVLFVDALDNGVEVSKSIYEDIRAYTISDYFYSYWMDENVSEENVDKIFYDVVILAKDLIRREIEKTKHILEEGKTVLDIYEQTSDKRLIILDQHYAWGKVMVSKPEPLFIVYPGLNGSGWNIKSVRTNLISFDVRKMFPLEWAGKTGSELVEVSGVSDAVFCHRGRFLAVAKFKEGAIKLAQIALNA